MTDGTVVAEEKNNATMDDATVDDKKKEVSGEEEDTKKTPSDKKEGAKEKKEGAKEKKEEKKKDGDNSEEEDSDEEPPPGLLDKPVEILYVRREKKNIEFFGKTKPGEEEEAKKGPDYSLGKGIKLADSPYVKYTLDKTNTDDLRVLHTMMYRSKGKKMMVKKNIRAFCGWPWDKDSKECNSVTTNTIDRMTVPSLKWTLDLLGVDRSGSDAAGMREALIEFMLKPYASEKKIPEKTKAKAKGKSKKKGGKSKASGKSKGKKKSGDEEEGDKSGDVSDDVSGEEEGEEEEKKPKKKTPAKKTPAKKSPAKKAPAKKKPAAKAKKSADVSDVSEPSDDSDSSDSDNDEGKKAKKSPAATKKAPAKKSPAKKRKAESDDSDESSDEPLMKKSNGNPPTDTELKDAVKALLKDTDLEQVTMKTVIKQVYDKFSSYDLTSRKDFIKGSVKELIS